jgi:cytochrome c553
MMGFILNNLATIIISVLLLGMVVAIILVMRKDKKSGKNTCGGNCSACHMCSACHNADNQK